MAHEVFNCVGYIINEYVPNMYKCDLFKDTHILSIVDEQVESIVGFEKYTNLKKIKISKFNSDLTPLQNCPIHEIWMDNFTGDLTPLAKAPIQVISMNKFNQDLSSLAKCPLQKVRMNNFNGNLAPLLFSPIEEIHIWDFKGDLSPLAFSPLKKVYTTKFNNNFVHPPGEIAWWIKWSSMQETQSPII